LDNPCTHVPRWSDRAAHPLCVGQHATVLQLPAQATAPAPAEARTRIAHGA
jgi:hypothetical protein